MKTAIVHDYLSQRGGAERVVLALSRIFPEAPVYTSIFAPERTYPEFADLDVRTSRLQGKVRPENFRRSVLSLPGVFAELDLSDFDRIVISSSAFAHHTRHRRSAVYCYAPPHFLYETATYLGSSLKAAIAWAPLEVLRRRDRQAAAAHRNYATISQQSAERVATIYSRNCPVIYPPLATAHLPSSVEPLPTVSRALVVSRLLPYKRVDVAIRACNLAGIALTVVGEGPELANLRRHGGRNVEFVGRVEDAQLRDLFVDHSVVLAPGFEDFGYGPVEANYAGRPVVALGAGGALETVEDGVNGARVSGWDVQQWADAISSVLQRQWSPEALRLTTERFSESTFAARIQTWVESMAV